MAHTLHDPRWLERERSASGVHVFDLGGDHPTSANITATQQLKEKSA